MKKTLLILLIFSIKIVAQTAKIEAIVNSSENTNGILAITKSLNPSVINSPIRGINKATNNVGFGVEGSHDGAGYGVYGRSIRGVGVTGFSQLEGTTGVFGLSYGVNSNGVRGYSENGYGNGVYGSAESGIGVNGYALNFGGTPGIGGFFSNAAANGYSLVTGLGLVGIGTTPNLNADEKMDINGRLRIRHGTSTSGVWFNNASNSTNYTNGAFYGMISDTQTGIFFGGSWKFWINNIGEISSTALTGTGYRMLLASSNGTIISNSQPQVWSVSANAFSSTTNGTPNFFKSTIMANFSSGSSSMVCPVNLPTGVLITEIKVFYKDNSSSDMNIKLISQLMQNSNTGAVSSENVGTYVSTNVSGIQSANLNLVPENSLIDNANKAYSLVINSSAWDNNLGIYSFKISYTY
jgi:hypothetical protein